MLEYFAATNYTKKKAFRKAPPFALHKCSALKTKLAFLKNLDKITRVQDLTRNVILKNLSYSKNYLKLDIIN